MTKITLVNRTTGRTVTVANNPIVLDAYGQRGYRPVSS